MVFNLFIHMFTSTICRFSMVTRQILEKKLRVSKNRSRTSHIRVSAPPLTSALPTLHAFRCF